MSPMSISKSNYIAGVQCLKRLYLQINHPELAAQPEESDYGRMEQGREVGLLARQLFPRGVEVSDEGGLEQATRTTSALVANPEVQAIFEGAFEYGGRRDTGGHSEPPPRWTLASD
jgi:hypothetical protein